MDKFMMFNENVRNVFNNEEVKFEAFNKLMIDTAYGKFEEGITSKDANEKIVAKFKANAVFPIAGLAATKINSEPCNPAVL